MSNGTGRLPISVLERIDNTCLDFESAWIDGRQPRIVDFLGDSQGAERAALLTELVLLEVDYRRRRGDEPAAAEYHEQFLHDRETVERIFANYTELLESPDTTSDQAAATTVSCQPEDPIPAHLGRYRVFEKLGSGGFGTVYRGYDDELRRNVAIKVPHRQHLSDVDLERFLAEARLLAGLNHRGIVPVHDVGRHKSDESPRYTAGAASPARDENAAADSSRTDETCFIVSQYMEGGDLATKVREARLSHTESALIIAEIAETIHYAHSQGLVHRDLKLSNILLDADGNVYVGDFGVALQAAHFGEGIGFIGTPAYMSPEQARGEADLVDGRTDVYALGVMLYELLTGVRPFQNQDTVQLLVEITTRPPKPPRQIDDGIPKELERICLKALSKQLSDRHTTALDLTRELRACNSASGQEETKRDGKLLGKVRTQRVRGHVAASLPTTTFAKRSLAVLGGLAAILLAVFALSSGGSNSDSNHDERLAETAQDEPGRPRTLVVPFPPHAAKDAQQAWADYLGTGARKEDEFGIEFTLVPPGKFLMGGSQDELKEVKEIIDEDLADQPRVREWLLRMHASESPRHNVQITRPFYLGTTEVTNGQFRLFVEATGYVTDAERKRGVGQDISGGRWVWRKGFHWANLGKLEVRDDCPVINVSYNDAVALCKWLTEYNSENKEYRLPTEAEWEFACRGGNAGRWCFGDDVTKLPVHAWYQGNSGTAIHPVGVKQPNAFGIFDMHGSRNEFCADYFRAYHRVELPEKDPRGPRHGGGCVVRGGAYRDRYWETRSAARFERGFDEATRTGIRLAREL